MIVRPDEISARSAPSTSPLKHCEMKLAQFITLPPRVVFGGRLSRRRRLQRGEQEPMEMPAPLRPVHGRRGRACRSGIVAEVAAKFVWLLHERLAGQHFEDLPVILLVPHVLRLLAFDDDDGAYALVVFGAVINVAAQRGDGLAPFVLLDDVRRIEGAICGNLRCAVGEADLGVCGTPFGPMAVFRLECFAELLCQRMFLVFGHGPPDLRYGKDTRRELRTYFRGKE